ncbi:MAG: TonB-dependent hemoglobin/transferrin/lactoferrin family receptor [Alphaproteobacteria bacterium]|nr:TonB-dependent hemoglobin/transferrin/lactoferrin family receptor [Alphaproteobacteria bacterium]
MKQINPLIYLSILAITLSSTAFAQDESAGAPLEPTISLETVTVVATKSPQNSFDIPGMVTVIDADSPELAGHGTPKELLGDVTGVEFGGSARSNGQDIKMRGYGTEGIVVLLDGVRQKFESRHDGRFFIDSALIKSVEVVRGPGSALYGSGGLGGVVAFKTKDASDLLAPNENMGATTTLGFQTVDDEWVVSQSAYGRTEKWDFLANVVMRESDDITLGDGLELQSEEELVSGLLKASWTLADFHTIRFSTQQYNIDAKEPNNPDLGNDPASLTDKTIESNTTRLAYEFSDPSNNLVNIKAQIYRVETDKEEEILAPSAVHAVGDVTTNNLETYGFNIENQSRFGEGTNLAQIITIGGEMYNEELDGADTGSMSGEADHYPDAEADYWGVFIQDEMVLNTQAGEFLIISALRYDAYESEDATGNSSDESRLSPKIGITYKPNEWLRLFSSYAQAFRAPNMEELYPTGIHFAIPRLGPRGRDGINRFVPNPDLEPETNDTIELGFGIQSLPQAQAKAQVKAAYFRIDSKDFINRFLMNYIPRPGLCCGTAVTENIDSASLWGYEIEGDYESERAKFGFGISYITGTNDANDDYLGTITPFTLRTNAALKLAELDSVLGWKATFADKQDQVNSDDEIRNGYGVHDIYYQWKPQTYDNMTVNLGIDNLFDKAYERAFAGSFEPGRNYRIQMSYKW